MSLIRNLIKSSRVYSSNGVDHYPLWDMENLKKYEITDSDMQFVKENNSFESDIPNYVTIMAKLIYYGNSRGFYELQTLMKGLHETATINQRNAIAHQLSNHDILKQYIHPICSQFKRHISTLAEAAGYWIKYLPDVLKYKKIKDETILHWHTTHAFIVQLVDDQQRNIVGEVYTRSPEDFYEDAWQTVRM